MHWIHIQLKGYEIALDRGDVFSTVLESLHSAELGLAPDVYIHMQQQGHQRTSGFISVPPFAFQNAEHFLTIQCLYKNWMKMFIVLHFEERGKAGNSQT